MQEQHEADGSEEFIIVDYDAPFTISEYDSIDEIAKKAKMLEKLLDDDNCEILEAILENYTNDFDEALEIISNYNYKVYYDCKDMADVAYEYCNETGILSEIPKNLQSYFDFEKFGRDMEIEGYFYYIGNCRYLEVFGEYFEIY